MGQRQNIGMYVCYGHIHFMTCRKTPDRHNIYNGTQLTTRVQKVQVEEKVEEPT